MHFLKFTLLKTGLWLMGLQLWLKPLPVLATTDRLCPAQLAGQLEAIANRPEVRQARWGILVQTLDNGTTLYAREADRYFIPGSNAKLLTTAAALTKLGAAHRIRTSVYRSNPEAEGVRLRVVGRGDPSFTDAQLADLIRQIQQQGIRRVDQLVADDRFFQGDPVNLNWEWEDVQAGYGAPVNSLILRRNAIALTLIPQAVGQPLRLVWDPPTEASRWDVDNRSTTGVAAAAATVEVGRELSRPLLHIQGQLPIGSDPEAMEIAIPDPTRFFLQRFRQLLVERQVTVMQTAIATQPMLVNEPEVAVVLSPPLSELLIEANQNSENIYAEALLRLLGVTTNTNNTLAAGVVAVEATLTPLGVNPQGYDLVDGSGLSRHNLVTPTALVQVLRGMARSPHATVFRNSLAVAGVSGTLRNRFRQTPIEGRLQGKTGALSGVAALSGYLTPVQHPAIAFSILLNHFDQPVRAVRPIIDDMVQVLGRLESCDPTPSRPGRF